MKPLIFLSIFFATNALASSYDLTSSVRAVGMGGAYTAAVDDSYSMFYNPAGLAKNSGVFWHIADLKVGASNEQALSNLQNVGGGGGSGLSSTLEPLMGEPVWISGGGHTGMIFPYFGVLYYYDVNANIELQNPAYVNFEVQAATDQGFGIGFGFPIIPGLLTSGVMFKRISRTGGTAIISGEVLGDANGDVMANLQNTGTAYSFDLGFNMTFPTPVMTPTFSLVYKNLGVTTFNNLLLDSEPENLILGAALEFDIPLFTLTPAIEFRNMTNYDMQLGNKIHLGVEFALPLIDIRAGFSQGYYSLGLGIGLGPMNLDFATYGVELGDYPGQLEDRRYVFSLSFDIGIDGVGGVLDSLTGEGEEGVGSARRRRLKQRR